MENNRVNLSIKDTKIWIPAPITKKIEVAYPKRVEFSHRRNWKIIKYEQFEISKN